MNERLKELEKQCWSHRVNGVLVDGHLHFDTEKFADLIVQECVAICVSNALIELDTNEFRSSSARAAFEITEYFGVK